jgi:hypothetical protein
MEACLSMLRDVLCFVGVVYSAQCSFVSIVFSIFQFVGIVYSAHFSFLDVVNSVHSGFVGVCTYVARCSFVCVFCTL